MITTMAQDTAPYMPHKPSSVGETMVCKTCEHFKKAEVVLVGKTETRTHDGKTETKLRWANQLDGSWHIKKVGDNFEHQLPLGEKPKKEVEQLSETEMANMYDVIASDDIYHKTAKLQVAKHGGDPDA